MEVQEEHTHEKSRSRSGMVVNTGVANIYGDPSFKSEVVTQAILGEMPETTDQQGKWFRVKQWDGYEGWIYYFYLVKNPDYYHGKERIRVNAPVTQIREEPAMTAASFRDAVFGVELPVLSREDSWTEVELPDGMTGWLQDEPLEMEGTARERLVRLPKLFRECPIIGGGKLQKVSTVRDSFRPVSRPLIFRYRGTRMCSTVSQTCLLFPLKKPSLEISSFSVRLRNE